MVCKHQTRAFTLIELLTCIVIIGLLIAILVPGVAYAKRYATRIYCRSNLKQVGVAVHMYRDDAGGAYPVARYMPKPFLSLYDDPSLPKALEKYMPGGQEVFDCRGDKQWVYPLTNCSYYYNTMLGGRDDPDFKKRLGGIKLTPSDIPVAFDCDSGEFLLETGEKITVPPFHDTRNFLFADEHVGAFE